MHKQIFFRFLELINIKKMNISKGSQSYERKFISLKISKRNSHSKDQQSRMCPNLLNSKICKLIKSKISPLKTPIKRVRKQQNNASSLNLPKIFNNKIEKKEVFREADPMNETSQSFTEIQKNVNKKAIDHVRKKRKALKSFDSLYENGVQQKPVSIIRKCIQIFQKQIQTQKRRQSQQRFRTTVKTLEPQLLQSIIQQSVFFTENSVKEQNKFLRKEILQDIKKQFDQEKSSVIRININHKKIISKLR